MRNRAVYKIAAVCFLSISPIVCAYAHDVAYDTDQVTSHIILQDTCYTTVAADESESKYKRAWEFGIGGTVSQFSRMAFSNFAQQNGNYLFDLNLSHVVWGGELYVARELNKHLYLDLKMNVGFTNKSIDRGHWMFMGGLGLQWRLGEYFKSKYIDPYLRVGANYMYKDFQIFYTGNTPVDDSEMSWILENYGNKEGRDKAHLFPVALGGGVNMWLNDRFGIGLQADYLLMPHGGVANSLQGTVRLIYRLGGKSKRPQPVTRYIDRPVERIVKKVVEVEKIVEVEKEKIVMVNSSLNALFSQICFAFDSYELTDESRKILDAVSEALKQDTTRHFLITGQTDAKGSHDYNMKLSQKRAETVVDALVERGVPAEMLKSRGVGKKIAAATPESADKIRLGDRKTVIELITNEDYWNYLK